MREVLLESRACGACGALVHVEGGAAAALTAVPRERSGLAYAAGYAGVLSLFRYSFVPLTLSGWWPVWALGAGLVLLFSLLAPLALVLSYAAAVSLDRSRGKAGRLPALFGLVSGWFGSYALLFVLEDIWRWLAPPG